MPISDQTKVAILNEINKKFPSGLRCPLCHNGNFSMIDSLTSKSLTEILEGGKVPNRNAVPTVSLVCKTCGNVIDFALHVLGFSF